jgi:hypothetical protein
MIPREEEIVSTRPMHPKFEGYGYPAHTRFIGGFLTKLKDKALDTWDAFWNKGHVPKRFRNFLKKHGNEKIHSIEMYRAPLDNVTNGLLNVVSLGQWGKIKEMGGHDTLFHVGIVLNGKYTMEKLEKLEAREGTDVLKNPEVTVYPVAVHKDLTINDMVAACAKRMGDRFITYDALGGNNCQDFVKNLLESVGLLTQGAKAWVYQDIKKLIEHTPSYMKWVSKGITDAARNVGNVVEAVVHKRGGFSRGGMMRPFGR